MSYSYLPWYNETAIYQLAADKKTTLIRILFKSPENKLITQAISPKAIQHYNCW